MSACFIHRRGSLRIVRQTFFLASGPGTAVSLDHRHDSHCVTLIALPHVPESSKEAYADIWPIGPSSPVYHGLQVPARRPKSQLEGDDV